jgi:hypothetical protein
LPFAGSANNHEKPSSLLGRVSCLMKVSNEVIVRLKKKPLVEPSLELYNCPE